MTNSLRPMPYSGVTALVTGGAGFIGSHLSDALLTAGANVRILDNLETGHVSGVPANAEFVKGCITDAKLVDQCTSGCSFVFHLAAMVSVPATVSDPERCFRTNVAGTQEVLRAASRHGVTGFVHTSTAAVYGSIPRLPSCEDDPIRCESPYAASKASGEFLVQAAARSAGFPGVSLRLFNVFGPRQDPKSPYAAAISAFLDAVICGRPIKVFGDGRQTRDFVPVGEVVRAFMHAGLHARTQAGECFNVGLGRETRILDIASWIQRAAGVEETYEFHECRPGDVQRSCASLGHCRGKLGFSPQADLEQCLRSMVRCVHPDAC